MRWRGTVLALALALPVAAAAQDDDRGYLTAWLEDNLSDAGRQVTITGFAGALSSRATMERLSIADAEGEWITLTNVVLDWNRAALLSGQVSINALTAEEIVVTRAPVADPDALPSPEARGFALPELPVSVGIGQIAAERISLGEALLGTEVEGRLDASAFLEAGEGRAQLTLERTDDGPDGLISLSASYANASRMLDIDLSAEEDAGGLATTLLGIPGAPAVTLTVAGSGEIDDFTADVRLATEGQDRLAGTVRLMSGTDGTQGFAVDLNGDLAPVFLPAYADFFGNSVALLAEGERSPAGLLTLRTLSVETRALVLNGNLTLAPDGLPEAFDLTGALGQPDGMPVLLPFGGADATRVERAEVAIRFDARDHDGWSGSVVVAGLDRADIAIDRLSLDGSGRISRSPAGNAVGGTVNYTAEGLRPADPALAEALGTAISGSALFHWLEGTDGFKLPRFTLNGDGFGLAGGGTVAGLETGITLDGRISADVRDLSRYAGLAGRPLGGAGRVEATGRGSLLGGSFDVVASVAGQDLRIGQPNLDGLLAGASRIDLSVERGPAGTVLRNLDLVASSLRATASGTVATAGSDIRADVDFSNLAVLGTGFGGALKGTARFVGPIDGGTLTLDADGTGLSVGRAEVDNLLRGTARIALEATREGDAVILRRASVAAASLTADVTGRLATAGSDLAATLDFSDLSALGGAYRGRLAAEASYKGTAGAGQFRLDGRGTDLAVGSTEADRLLSGQSTVAVAGRLSAGAVRIDEARLVNPQLTVNATGDVTGNTRRLNVEARLQNLGLILPEFPGPLSISGAATEDAQGYRLDLRGQGPGGIDATVRGQLAPDFRRGDLALSGRAQAALANAFIDPASVAGGVDFDLRLNGPLALQSLSGRASLSGGRVAAPGLPAALQDLAVTADLAGGSARIAGTGAVSTGGRVVAGGTVGLAPPNAADLQVTLDRVVLRDPELYETRANGTLTVTGPLTGGATIAGRVALIETELRIPSTGMTGGDTLPELRHVNEPAPVRQTRARAGLLGDGASAGTGAEGRPFALDLQIAAPNRVFVRGRGLDAELGGALRLRGTTVAIVPEGGFELIRGRLDILGARLDLTEATLRLEGDFVPTVTIRASNESDGIISSVGIEGRVDDPAVTFTSVPELPQEEVLARLLFGRGLDNISVFQAAQLASAVATLAGRGGEGIVGRLRQGFGLDNLDVATSEDGETTVRAGKYLSRNLYTEVEVDQAGKSQINLNLDVSRSVTVRGRLGSDGDTGIGIFLERDY